MTWWEFALLGGAGGVLVEALTLMRAVGEWQKARRTPTGRVRSRPAGLRTYVDVPAHLCVGLLRAALGAAAAAIFGATGQISGAYVALAIGFMAPSVLAQLGSVPQVASAVTGVPTPDPAPEPLRPGAGDGAAAPSPSRRTPEATGGRDHGA